MNFNAKQTEINDLGFVDALDNHFIEVNFPALFNDNFFQDISYTKIIDKFKAYLL